MVTSSGVALKRSGRVDKAQTPAGRNLSTHDRRSNAKYGFMKSDERTDHAMDAPQAPRPDPVFLPTSRFRFKLRLHENLFVEINN